MPTNNTIANKLKETSGSNYWFQKTIKSGHHKFPVSQKGCKAFIKDDLDETECDICGSENNSNSVSLSSFRYTNVF